MYVLGGHYKERDNFKTQKGAEEQFEDILNLRNETFYLHLHDNCFW